MCGPQTSSARMTGGGLAMASPYGCRGNGIRAIHHVLPERLQLGTLKLDLTSDSAKIRREAW